jgi:hypothetical protein
VRNWSERPFGTELDAFMKRMDITAKTLLYVAGIDRTLVSKYVNNSRVPRAWKAFLMGWQLGVHYASRRLTTPDGRLLCTA